MMKLPLLVVFAVCEDDKTMTWNGTVDQYFNIKLSLFLTEVSFDSLEEN